MTLRIAICFFGITRSLSHTIGSIEQRILEPARKHGDLRIFAHFFRQLEIDNPRSGESGMLRQDEHILLNPDWLELEDPELCLADHDFERLKACGDRWNDEFRSLRNLVHQLHSLDRVTNAALDWDADIYIFARPDLMYHDSFDRVLRRAVNSRRRTAYIPAWQRWHGGLNDRFAVCVGAEAARAYGTRLAGALAFAESDGALLSERLLGHALTSSGIRVKSFGVRASRLRSDGRFRREDFTDKRPVLTALRRVKQGLLRLGPRTVRKRAI